MYYVYEFYHRDIIRNNLQHFSNICLNLNTNNIILLKILVFIINKC